MCVFLVRKWLRHSFIMLNDMILIFLNFQNLWLRNWRPFSNDLTVFSTNVTNWKLLNMKFRPSMKCWWVKIYQNLLLIQNRNWWFGYRVASEVFSKTLAFARKVVDSVTFWWINKAVIYWTLNTVCSTGKKCSFMNSNRDCTVNTGS